MKQTSDSLEDALEALKEDHDFLLSGNVFDQNFIREWIELKMYDVYSLRERPHPHEFTMYYDI